MTDHATMKSRASELRRNQTPAERELWKRLRLRQACSVRFLRQYVIGHCILDFYAPSIRLAVELDGGQHYEPHALAHDEVRSEWLAARDIEVLRYTNLEVSRRIDDVLDDILRAVLRLQEHPPAATRRPPSSLFVPGTWWTGVRGHGGHIQTSYRAFGRSVPMPWQEVSTMQLRREFVLLVEQGSPIRGLCRRFGISPGTAYKWLDRRRAGEGLADRSRRPAHSPARSEVAVESAVLKLRATHPKWGARKLRRWLSDRGQPMPAVSTVHAILARHGCIEPAASAASQPWQRFEHAAPNDLWQMDFKGHFGLRDGGRCHPLTLLDDHSRYNLCLAACAGERGERVRAHLIATFRRYGLPRRMSMDNGPPWGDTGAAYTAMDVWLMKQGIRVSHSRPYHPQTQGKDERFHRTLNLELLQGRQFDHLQATQHAFDHWREIYNLERPHEALGLEVPMHRYRASPLAYREHPAPPEYGDTARVRHVQAGGWIRWQQRPYRVGKAFVDEPVEVRATTDARHLEVYWSSHRIARIDLFTHTSIHGRNLP